MAKKIIICILVVAIGLSAGYGLAYLANETSRSAAFKAEVKIKK